MIGLECLRGHVMIETILVVVTIECCFVKEKPYCVLCCCVGILAELSGDPVDLLLMHHSISFFAM